MNILKIDSPWWTSQSLTCGYILNHGLFSGLYYLLKWSLVTIGPLFQLELIRYYVIPILSAKTLFWSLLDAHVKLLEAPIRACVFVRDSNHVILYIENLIWRSSA